MHTIEAQLLMSVKLQENSLIKLLHYNTQEQEELPRNAY